MPVYKAETVKGWIEMQREVKMEEREEINSLVLSLELLNSDTVSVCIEFES